MSKARKAHLVWQSGIGREMQRKGSNVLLCFWQWGHVSEDLRKREKTVIERKSVVLTSHRLPDCFQYLLLGSDRKRDA